MKTAATVLCLFIITRLTAQAPTDYLRYIQSFGITPAQLSYEKKLPVNHIRIIDGRYDTTKIGFAVKGGNYQKVTVNGGFRSGVEQTLNSSLAANFDASSNQSLVIVIKKYWLKETNYAEKENRKMVVANMDMMRSFSECNAKLEVYLEKENVYYPVFRMDSSYDYVDRIKKAGGDILMAPFEACLDKLQYTQFDKLLAQGKKLTWKQIEDYNAGAFTYPILHQMPGKIGLYLTFHDFLQNKITEEEFALEHDAFSDRLFILKGNDKTLFTDFWGFYDGRSIYIKSGLNFYPLVRRENTFEFLGTKSISTRGGSNNNPVRGDNVGQTLMIGGLERAISNGNAIRKEWKPFQLNLDEGEIY